MESKEVKEAEVVNEIPSDLSFERKTLSDISLEIAESVVEKENEKELFPKKYSRLDILEAASKIQEKLLNSNEFRENVKKTIEKEANKFLNQGKTVLYFAENNKILGIIAVRDEVKKDSAQAISELHKLGIKTAMAFSSLFV